MQNDTGEPLAKKPKLSEYFLPSTKTAKALSEILGTTKDVMLYAKTLKKCYKKFKLDHKEHFLKHLAHIKVQVLKQCKEINEVIVEWSANFKKVSHKIPTENHMNKDPVIAKTWKKIKVATELLKIWQITIHLPK